MANNEEIKDENGKAQEENNNTNEQENLENVSNEPTTEEILAEEKDKYIRLYAEFENYKKRTTKERMEFFQYASQDMMVTMIGVLDDFERALKNMEENSSKEELEGIELIYNKFKSKLEEKGLQTLEVKPGDQFNVDLHEAITQIPAPSEELKGKVVDVIETGYKLHDRVIRFAKVVTGQ